MSHVHGRATLLSSSLLAFVQQLDDCERACRETIQYCLQIGGKHTAPDHIKLLADCANICQTTSEFTSRRSSFLKSTAALCADLCDACATSCEQFKGDRQMQECAAICRACEASCRQVAS